MKNAKLDPEFMSRLSGISLQILEAAPSGMVVVDGLQPDMPIIYANAAFETITGYSRDEIMGKNCRFLQADDLDQAQLDLLRSALHNQTECVLILRNYRKDGSLFWNELRVSPIRDPDGVVRHYVGITNDITQRIQAEQYLQGILDSSLHGITAFRSVRDETGTIIDFEWTLVNQQAGILSGRTHADLIGKRLLQEMPGHSEDTLFDRYVQVVESGEPLHLEHYYKHERVDSWFQITAVKLADGFVLTFADITDQKLLQQNLEDKHAELDRYFTLALDLLCIADTDGNFIKVNTAWENILGYPVADLQGKRFLDFVHPDDLQATLKAISRLDQQEVVLNFTNRYQSKSGEYRYIEWRSHPDGKYIYAAARDITERKEMEKSLRQSQERLQMTLSGIGAGAWEWNIETGENIINDRWAEILGYRREELIPLSIEALLYHIHPDDLEILNNGLSQHFQDQTNYYEAEYRMKHKDGHWVWILDRGKVMQWTEAGNPWLMFGTHMDITQHKQTQQHKFEIALEKARTQVLSDFIQNAAHEFRTPLSIINSSVYMMSKTDAPDKRKTYAERIQNQVNRTIHLVDMLSMMAELESKSALTHEMVDISGVIEAICTQMQTTDAGPTISCDLEPSMPHLQGNAEDLHEALRQIMDNALKHTGADGQIIVRGVAAANALHIEIEDSGSGISETALPHIFETFWRQDEAHTRPGFGLGLAIARKIIQMHGGQIEVESQLQQGTRFRIHLPLTAPLSA